MKPIIFISILTIFLAFPFLANAQINDKPKTQATTMVMIDQHQVDTTTSPNVRAMIQILRNKQKYIGQPFSVLLKDLPDSIKYFYPFFISQDMSEQKYYAFGFDDFYEMLIPHTNYFQIAAVNITWQTPIKLDSVRHFLIEKNNWNKEAEGFLAPHIVEDIEMVRPIEVSKAGGWLNWH